MGLLIVPVTLGASVVYLPRFNPTQAVEIIREHKVSVLIAIPSMLGAIHRLKSARPEDLASLELTVAGGEPLPQTLLQEFKERFGTDVLEGYGMTETSPVLTINVPWANRPGSVGRPIPGVEARVVDEEDRVLAAGEEGEIQIRGPHVTPGYYNKPAETGAAFRPGGWFCTGDIGKIDADGYVWITGRKKEMIIVGGENVFPREVEGVLEDHAAVAEAAVIGQPDASRGEVVTAYVMLREGQTATEIGLRDHCRERLAGYKVPRTVHIVEDMPRGPTGKVLRRKLREESQPTT
jgi:long-chain acyl-CoA synthetase